MFIEVTIGPQFRLPHSLVVHALRNHEALLREVREYLMEGFQSSADATLEVPQSNQLVIVAQEGPGPLALRRDARG